MSVKTAVEECEKMRGSLGTGDIQSAAESLVVLKNVISQFESLPPMNLETANAPQERLAARTMYELAVALAVRQGDHEGFQRYVSSLRPYYARLDLPDSSMKDEIMGLNLLFLIVENRMADFHSELELLSEEQRRRPSVAFCSRLDQLLMVGSYDQVMSAAAHPPCESYSFFLVKLLRTVRTNIGECAASSYRTLTVAAAGEILMFNSKEETLAFIAENYPHWELNGNTITLCSVKVNKFEEIPAMKLISQTLAYASELERIV